MRPFGGVSFLCCSLDMQESRYCKAKRALGNEVVWEEGKG